VSFVDTEAPETLASLVDDSTAAIVVEPIQGEGGVRPLSPALVDAISAACRRTGTLLIADEVQSGSWRTGPFLRSRTIGLSPDLVSLGKALGAGVPVGATLLSGKVAAAIAPGDHGTTYGGNLLACRAALTFLDEVEAGLTSAISRVSGHLFTRLQALAARTPVIKEVRGAGLFVGIELATDAAPVIEAARERGLLVNRTAGTVVRLLPAYIATERDVDEAVDILTTAMAAV
jgi:acetylornithine/succinyldiaminopimelate/putrescine aminotransferase